MKVYTIGFTQKTAEEFFGLLQRHHVQTLIDVRLNHRSQLAGFAKQPDLQYFLKQICGIKYIHDPSFAPTEGLLKRYRAKETSWAEYEVEFDQIMRERNISDHILATYGELEDQIVCLLCSEPTAEKCHRRLVAERWIQVIPGEIIHL